MNTTVAVAVLMLLAGVASLKKINKSLATVAAREI